MISKLYHLWSAYMYQQQRIIGRLPLNWVGAALPGVGVALVVALLALGGQEIETRLLGQPVIEALVLAILIGMLVRSVWGQRRWMAPGVAFAAKEVLEVAIVLLGASIDLPALLHAGPALLLAVVLAVAASLVVSSAIGRSLGLSRRLALLVACGNSICGNSAIAAVAPVIGAADEEVAASIALTAVLGVVVVLLLPLLIPLLGLSFYQYGVLAGMTVYAVPQVLAATFPVSTISGQIGTLVKLVRVLLLGPVVLFFAARFPRSGAGSRLALTRAIPWFIVGFLIFGVLRSVGALPVVVADPMREGSRLLTVVAMAGLGLGVDVRALRNVGGRVAWAVIGSLCFLLTMSVLLIRLFGIVG